MAHLQLVELDLLEVVAIVDNELDPITPCTVPNITQDGGLRTLGLSSRTFSPTERGGATGELSMEQICCGAHGLSLFITGQKDGIKRTILFDTGPEEHSWERNAKRLRVPIENIEVIQLSHWHRDHSGGMIKAVTMIREAQIATGMSGRSLVVDLHPARPDYRGFRPPGMQPMSLEADPTFEEITAAGATVAKHDDAHTVLGGMFLVSGMIERTTPYERGMMFGVRFAKDTGQWTSDELFEDERFLMCKVKDKGIVVFSGCSHAGVVNAARHAVQLGNGASLHAVMGGYHLADAVPETIQATAADLKVLDPTVLLPGHCTGWRAKFEFASQMPGRLAPSFVGTHTVF